MNNPTDQQVCDILWADIFGLCRRPSCLDLLSEEEQDQAHTFQDALRRRHFLAGRALARRYLGKHLDLEPSSVPIGISTKGKPYLVEAEQPSSLRFSIAHSARIAVCAFVEGAEVGADIERLDPKLDWNRIARRVLPKDDLELIESLPLSRQHRAFYECWTRHEAILKAKGSELASSLGKGTSPDEWSLLRVRTRPGYIAAVAVEGAGVQVRVSQVSCANSTLTF